MQNGIQPLFGLLWGATAKIKHTHLEFSRLFKLIRIFREKRPAIVHTYMFAANSYGRVAAIITRVPTIIASERNVVEAGKDKKKYWVYIDKLLASFSHGIICNTHDASEFLVNNYSYDNKKVFTVHNGIRVTDILGNTSAKNKLGSSQKLVGTVGRLYPQKNHKLFLDMAKTTLDRSERNSIRFLVVGAGLLQKQLIEYASELGIEGNVVFTGERDDIPRLLNDMDVFVMTSLYEGLSNAIMEAMVVGVPVVATDVGGNSELVVDGETGFICPSNDADALARKVIYLLNNADVSRSLGERGRNRIFRKFSVENMINKTEEIYNQLLETVC